MRFIHQLVQLAVDTRTVPSPFGAHVYFYSSTMRTFIFTLFILLLLFWKEASEQGVLSDLSFLRIPNRSNLARGVKAKAAGCKMY
jgi:hypothetical protein